MREKMNLTEEQIAITEAVHGTTDNLIVEALAGTGKTTTIIESLKRLPQRSALICAFNKRIAEELVLKVPKMPRTHAVHVKTFHALGLRALKAHFPYLEVDGNATEELVNQCAADGTSFQIRRAAIKVLRTYKEVHTYRVDGLMNSLDVIAEIGFQFDLWGKLVDKPGQLEQACRLVKTAYEASFDLEKRRKIDFCDMVWAPVVRDLAPPSRYLAVFIDELQDVSQPQFELLMAHRAPAGRVFGVGDRRQAIYGWRGAIGAEIWYRLKSNLNARVLPLTTTFRCSHAVVKAANEIVPELRAGPDARVGSVSTIPWSGMSGFIAQKGERSVYVLSRNNAELLKAALFLWQKRTRFMLNAGREMLDPLFLILERLDKTDVARFRASLTTWFTENSKRAEAAHAAAWADRLVEQYAMLEVASRYAAPKDIEKLLTSILTDEGSGVLLSTVHKVKGLEADLVLLLKQTFGRYQDRDRGEPIDPEELNIEYVGITRARDTLIWVDMDDPGYYSTEIPG